MKTLIVFLLFIFNWVHDVCRRMWSLKVRAHYKREVLCKYFKLFTINRIDLTLLCFWFALHRATVVHKSLFSSAHLFSSLRACMYICVHLSECVWVCMRVSVFSSRLTILDDVLLHLDIIALLLYEPSIFCVFFVFFHLFIYLFFYFCSLYACNIVS